MAKSIGALVIKVYEKTIKSPESWHILLIEKHGAGIILVKYNIFTCQPLAWLFYGLLWPDHAREPIEWKIKTKTTTATTTTTVTHTIHTTITRCTIVPNNNGIYLWVIVVVDCLTLWHCMHEQHSKSVHEHNDHGLATDLLTHTFCWSGDDHFQTILSCFVSRSYQFTTIEFSSTVTMWFKN